MPREKTKCTLWNSLSMVVIYPIENAERKMKENRFVGFCTMLIIYNLPRDMVPVEKIVWRMVK